MSKTSNTQKPKKTAKRRIKLDMVKAKVIRTLHFKKGSTAKALASKYHVAIPTITHVLYGITWK